MLSNTFENSIVRSESIQKLHDLQLLQSMYASQNSHNVQFMKFEQNVQSIQFG